MAKKSDKSAAPELKPAIILDVSCGKEFKTLSTLETEEKREEDGVEYNVIRIEVSSASHPFFTGEQQLMDTARRVEKFEAKQKKHAEIKETATHRSKKEKRAARREKKSDNKQSAKAALKAAKAALQDM